MPTTRRVRLTEFMVYRQGGRPNDREVDGARFGARQGLKSRVNDNRNILNGASRQQGWRLGRQNAFV
jgi:hypothetical protein